MPGHTKQERAKRRKKKITELVGAGTPFNPQAVSGLTLNIAAGGGSFASKKEIERRLAKTGQFEHPIPKPGSPAATRKKRIAVR